MQGATGQLRTFIIAKIKRLVFLKCNNEEELHEKTKNNNLPEKTFNSDKKEKRRTILSSVIH